jgi:glycosyltransferase involved in cell wall biosynthesis
VQARTDERAKPFDFESESERQRARADGAFYSRYGQGVRQANARETGPEPILLALTTSMGWSIFGERMNQEARANWRDNVVFHPFTPSALGRRMSWQTRYADRAISSLGIFDPFTVAEWQVAATPRLCGEYSAAIVATQNLAAGLIRRHPKMPVFLIVDATRQLYRDELGASFITERNIARERDVFLGAAHIFALTKWAANSVMRMTDIDASRVSILPPASFRCRGTPMRTPLSRNGRLQLLFAGMDFERKGGARLLRWQREAWSAFADLHIVTRTQHVDPTCPNTIWYGPVSNDRLVHEIMPRMDILVHPAERECSPLVVGEAAGNGVPALISAINGLGELVQDGVTGCVARDDAAFRSLIPQLYRNRGQIAEMGINAKAVADERNSADQVYSTIMKVVRSHLRS